MLNYTERLRGGYRSNYWCLHLKVIVEFHKSSFSVVMRTEILLDFVRIKWRVESDASTYLSKSFDVKQQKQMR